MDIEPLVADMALIGLIALMALIALIGLMALIDPEPDMALIDPLIALEETSRNIERRRKHTVGMRRWFQNNPTNEAL